MKRFISISIASVAMLALVLSGILLKAKSGEVADRTEYLPSGPSTGEMLTYALVPVLTYNPNYQMNGMNGSLPIVISGTDALEIIRIEEGTLHSDITLDRQVKDFITGMLFHNETKVILIEDVPNPNDPDLRETFLFIDTQFNHHPFAIPSILDNAPAIVMTPTNTNAGCEKRLIKIGYDGPPKDFCGCMPHYGCTDSCDPNCTSISNADSFVRSILGNHPMLEIQVPWTYVGIGQSLADLMN